MTRLAALRYRRLLAVDPGPVTCGAVCLRRDGTALPTIEWARPAVDIGEVCSHALGLSVYDGDEVAVEWLTSYGTAVGASVLDTARAVGRIAQCAVLSCVEYTLITRPEVSLRLVGTRRGTDAQVHESIRQMYRDAGMACGGGADPTKGVRAQPGPLYGVTSHAWDALAVGLAHLRGAQ